MNEQKAIEAIRAAVIAAQAEGYRIDRNGWGVSDYLESADFPYGKFSSQFVPDPKARYCVCPIGAYLLNKPTIGSGEVDMSDTVIHYLGVTRQWVSGFVHGFDGGELVIAEKDTEVATDFRNGFSAGQTMYGQLASP